MALKTTVIQDSLGSNRSTTSGSFVNVVESDILFTPTYGKLRISQLLNGFNTMSGEKLFIRITLDGVVGNEANVAEIESTTTRTTMISDIWDVEPNVEVTIRLQFRVSGGTGTLLSAVLNHWQFIEYD